MTLRKCPGCKNMVSAESPECPVCGCEPRKRMVRQFFIWALLAACVLYLGTQVVAKKWLVRAKSHSHAEFLSQHA